jgi:hypothetical protein
VDSCEATLGCTHTGSCTADMAGDAGTSASSGGCSIGGSADRNLTGVWLLLAALLVLGRRRRQRKSE